MLNRTTTAQYNAGDMVKIVGEKSEFTIGEAIGFSDRLNTFVYVVRDERGSCIRDFPQYNIIGRVSPAKPRYAVFSVDRYSLDSIPAGEYDSLNRAIAHAETVTYKMAVTDRKAESRGFVYTNYQPDAVS